jgi:hypothetical protein
MDTVEMTAGHPLRRGMPRAQGIMKFPALSAVSNKISDIFRRYLVFCVLPGERNETRSTDNKSLFPISLYDYRSISTYLVD